MTFFTNRAFLKNYFWYIVIGCIFCITTNLVCIRLYVATPPAHYYTGLGLEAAADKFVYFSMIQQGIEGRLFMQNVHTPEAQKPVLFSPHWYLIGQIARMFQHSIRFAYHASRIVLIVAFLVAMALVTRRIFEASRDAIIAYGSALFASGLGWLYFLFHQDIARSGVHWMQYFNKTPADLYVTELSPFMSSLQSPLFILSYGLILCIWLLYIESVRPKAMRSLGLFACSFLLIVIHPYDAFLILSVSGSLAVWDLYTERSFDRFAFFVPIAAGVVAACIYHLVTVYTEPALKGWLIQNITFSPSFANYAWALGIMGPTALLGLFFIIKQRRFTSWWRLVLLWAFWIFVGIYLPLDFNRRISSTWFVPMSFLGYLGVRESITLLRHYLAKALIAAVCVIILISGTLYHVAQQLFYVPTAEEKYSYYLDPYMRAMLSVLHETLSYHDVLLTNTSFTGMLAAAYAPTRVYVGHPHQTSHFELRENAMDWFFAEPGTEESVLRRRAFLKDNGITAIMVYKPSMREGSYDWIDSLPGVTRVYDSVVGRIFTVAP